MVQDRSPMLNGRNWLIEDIAGAGVINDSKASLHFLHDGSLVGDMTCNRLIGSFESPEERSALHLTGATRMDSPPASSDQERKLLGLLAQVTSHRFDETGVLILATA